MASKYTLESRLGSLPHGVISMVCKLLLVSQSWKDLASTLTHRNGTPMFSYDDILVMELYTVKAPEEVLKNLMTSNYTVKEFLNVLRRAQLHRVADYIHTEVLKDAPDSRQTTPGEPTYQEIYEAVSRHKSPEVEYMDYPLEKHPPDQGPSNKNFSPAVSQEKYMDEPVEYVPGHPHQFHYDQLKHLTNDFNRLPFKDGGNFLGKGGFSEVFYARLGSVQELAVKRLTDSTQFSESQLLTEVETMSWYDHENLLQLLGYSDDGSYRCIVYPYMPNGSLGERLTCPDGHSPLTVFQRTSIMKGTARGINHLHTSRDKPLIHRDIKSANILLDNNFVPKLGDFGLARVGPPLRGPDTSQETCALRGTMAYMPPESLEMKVSIKWDVFSFGVVLLELLTGLPPYDPDRECPNLASHMTEECDDIMMMLDSKAGQWLESAVQPIYGIANRCLESTTKNRPTIQQVLTDVEAVQD